MVGRSLSAKTTAHSNRPGRLWQLVEERMARPGSLEGADRFWGARMVEQ